MSIIYNTLTRLEQQNPGLVDDLEKEWPSAPVGRSMGFPMKALATAMVLVFVGSGLVVWHLNGQLSDLNGVSLANAGGPVAADLSSHEQFMPVPDDAGTVLRSEPTVRGDDTATSVGPPLVAANVKPDAVEPPDAPPESNLAALVAETDGPAREKTRSATNSKPVDKPPVVASVKPEAVEPSAAKRDSAPVAAGKPQAAEAAAVPEPKLAAVAPRQKRGSATKSQPVEKPPVVASVKPEVVEPSAAKPKAASVESRKQRQQAEVVAAVQPDNVDQTVEKARVALSMGRYPEALELLGSLSPVPERRADFWLMKGSAHLALGQLDLAETAFASAQPLAPDNVQISVQIAILKQEKGDHAGALQILADAASRHPNVPEIFLNQGYSQQELGALRDAGRSFRIFLRMTEGRSLYAEQRRAIEEWLAQPYHTSG